MAMDPKGTGDIYGGCNLENIWVACEELLEPRFYTQVPDIEGQVKQIALLFLMQH